MKYNTQQKKMLLPEYGRSVQNMVDYCITIADKDERQRCANTIITIMGNMFPQYRDIPDFKHKLWDHLAIMSDFKLDIDYPYEVIRQEKLFVKPDSIPYPSKEVLYRHYGIIIEKLIRQACEMEEGEERDSLVALICNHMRLDYVLWNKDVIDDAKIEKDLNEYSKGKLHLTENVARLMQLRTSYFARPTNERKNNSKNNQKGRKNYKK